MPWREEAEVFCFKTYSFIARTSLLQLWYNAFPSSELRWQQKKQTEMSNRVSKANREKPNNISLSMCNCYLRGFWWPPWFSVWNYSCMAFVIVSVKKMETLQIFTNVPWRAQNLGDLCTVPLEMEILQIVHKLTPSSW